MRKRLIKKTPHPEVMPGVDVFLRDHLDLVKNKKVGLLTNLASVDGKGNRVLDLFYGNPDIDVVALFGPEHGLGGAAQAGEYVPFARYAEYDLPVYSLYGQELEQAGEALLDLDEKMRSFDTRAEGKLPASDMLEQLDVFVCDLQDVGTRVYTYAATMAYCMAACAESGVDFILLDRPNPLNGIDMEGPVLEYPAFSSFVGLYPIPMRHAMTMGELAKLICDKFLPNKPVLTVIPMSGWRRDMWFDETALPWVPPSPNMAHFKTAQVYPGQVLLEGTNLSEGRGTAFPFELFGSPWIRGECLSQRLNKLGLPGVKFEKAEFVPDFSKYQGELCGGCRLQISNRHLYPPFETTLYMITTITDLYPGEFQYHADYFDKVAGTNRIRTGLELGKKVVDILGEFEVDLSEFSKRRVSYLLY
jgi:uncharacterized protein YbbC (DUF1343 family)